MKTSHVVQKDAHQFTDLSACPEMSVRVYFEG